MIHAGGYNGRYDSRWGLQWEVSVNVCVAVIVLYERIFSYHFVTYLPPAAGATKITIRNQIGKKCPPLGGCHHRGDTNEYGALKSK